jgi:hypothetical protein
MDKQAALAVYQERGLAAAHRETGVAKSTLRRWAQAAGMETARLAARTVARTKAATAQHVATMGERRVTMAEGLMTEAETELTRLRQPFTEWKQAASGKEASHEYAEPPPIERQRIATTLAILVDKSNLLAGEATSRSENLTVEQAREKLAEVLHLRVVDGTGD